MPYLLNLAYLLLLLLASPWLLYRAVRQGKYRQGIPAKLLGQVPRRTGDQPCLWLHAVSVGEVNLLQPLLAGIEQQHPDWQCVISTTTRTGFELARKKYAPRTVFYCPLDFSWAVKSALRRVRPNLLVLVELELWPNLVRLSHRQGVRVALINGRLSESSFRGYRLIRPLVASMLRRFDLIAVQNEVYAERYRQLGASEENVHITGSMKFDGAITDRKNARTIELASLARFDPQDIVLMAGSTQKEEELLAVTTFKQLAADHPRLRLVIVPRHPERFDEVAEMLDRSTLGWQRRSELAEESSERSSRVLLVDVVGELGAWWGSADIALVGGSFGTRGGQNMIEPAAYGAAVSFGPQTQNFRDVVQLMLDADAARVVDDQQQFTAFVESCLLKPDQAKQLGLRAQQLVREQLGATTQTLQLVAPLVEIESLDRGESRE
jgi:3-deoxy-D-manno-octulosonic-acid transferase